MGTIAFPNPKPGASRPPLPPSLWTAFNPDDEGQQREPYHKVLAESVRQLLKAVRYDEVESMPLMRRLIQQRKEIILRELGCERMMASEPMPPLLSNYYILEMAEEDEPVRVYKKLLSQLDEAAERIDLRLKELNG
jgi:hypothetical protein